MAQVSASYPVSFSVDYPERLNRLTTFFRIFVAIPIFIVLSLASGSGFLFLPVLVMLLFRQKYPRWWFDWNVALYKFMARVSVYMFLLRDEYPSTDEEQAVHLDMAYPDAKALNRWLPLVKWFLAIPHMIVLYILEIVVTVCVVIAWFAIIFTGRFPRGLFDFVMGVYRWGIRVSAYAFLLVTDIYPPFSLSS